MFRPITYGMWGPAIRQARERRAGRSERINKAKERYKTMGTRHITIVKLDGEYKVAQYGQWDGYPSGQGATVLEFLKSWDRPVFEHKLRASGFITDEGLGEINDQIKAQKLGSSWGKRWPEFSRDTGAEILALIQNRPPGIKLQNQLDFAADSLFCEWGYVLDLDANALEVYKVFNKQPLTEADRFYPFEEKSEGEYHPIKLVAKYDLSALPDQQTLENDCDPAESEATT